MFEKLQSLAAKYEQLQEKLFDPAISADHIKMTKINREMSWLKKTYELYLYIKEHTEQLTEAKEILDNKQLHDEETLELAKEQKSDAEKALEWMEEKVKIALLPKDPNDEKNIYLEIRPAAWWDESWLFAAELLRMYLLYSDSQWWKHEIMEHQRTWIWWIKFAMVKIAWESIYSKLKFESWVHRVQRIPDTESQWRVHTSTITVAVMPEVDDVEVHIDPNDVEMDTFAASSSWGQHANKNQTWVRLHHKPTWIIAMWTDSKSQLQNKDNAWKMLKTKVYQLELDKQMKDQKEKRFDQVWTWDRSEKVRTYNFPQDRITDHRIKQSRSNIPWKLNWDIEDIISSLIIYNQTKLLEVADDE